MQFIIDYIIAWYNYNLTCLPVLMVAAGIAYVVGVVREHRRQRYDCFLLHLVNIVRIMDYERMVDENRYFFNDERSYP